VEKVSVIVLPLSVHSSENLDYIRQGVWDMLSNRLSANEKIQVISKESVSEFVKKYEGKEPGSRDLQDLGKKLNADYIVWGSMTKIGNGISLDCKLFQVSSTNTSLYLSAQAQGLDDVIPKIGGSIQSITAKIIGKQTTAASPPTIPATPATAMPVAKPPVPDSGSINRESQIIQNMKSGGKGTFTSVINPNSNASTPFN